MSLLAIRREVIDYGAIPLSSWLHHGDTPAALQSLLLQLIEVGREEGSRCECPGFCCCDVYLSVLVRCTRCLKTMSSQIRSPAQQATLMGPTP